ncbi:MAG: right-handed parallel beta-helix repeat-containing protein [Bacteroidia bacterium]|nr:right-handed parallel beta-helix repeat-containing protein [Bacteroidia bacterium]NND25336.1 right-handed parallel beta-helix repeat-containing protein [Flavobacteriaceae bacterium]
MKLKKALFIIIFMPLVIWSQQEFHVFPPNHSTTPGMPSGNGSLQKPWDLQTALDQLSNTVDGGDTIWLHEGVYSGRYISSLGSSNARKKIVVDAYQNQKVVLNGNVASKRGSVLEVRGSHVSFRNIEITFIGEFARKQGEKGFEIVNGLNHVSGVNCEFINLKIHNNPGSGLGSWKRTGGTLIYGCTIFNNGYFSTKRGSGVGMYIQNESNAIRMVKNNIIFNNYYKGVQVWSASKKAKTSYVKNVTLKNNVIFNNGLPGKQFRDNIIVATDDRNGINIAKNIKIIENIIYHNTDIKSFQNSGHGTSLSLGYRASAPLEAIEVINNVFIGRNYALRFVNAKDLIFKNNTVYTAYLHFNKSALNNISKWKFDNNTYFTKNKVPFRVAGSKDYSLNDWKAQHVIESKSSWQHLKEFNLRNVLTVKQNEYDSSKFTAVLFEKNGANVSVDLSKFDLKKNQTYDVLNISNGEVLFTGRLSESKIISMPIGTLNNTNSNFGVFEIKFDKAVEKKMSFLTRWLKWLF